MNTHKDLLDMVCTEATETNPMSEANLCPACGQWPQNCTCQRVSEEDAFMQQLENALQQDRMKTQEINILVKENRELRKERDELQEQLAAIIAPVECGGGIEAHLAASKSKRLCFDCAKIKGRAGEWRDSRRPVWTAFCQSCEHRREVRVLTALRACPQCKNDTVIEDGYCGTCRQCTLYPEPGE